MDVLDLHVNCQVSLRSKQSKLSIYPDSYRALDAWPPSAHMATLTETTDHHRGRNRNTMYPDHSGFHPIEGHYDLQNVSGAQNDPWSMYNYNCTAFHPYYHGYGQQESVDLFPPSSLVVSTPQYYPSWHLPYGSAETSHHGNLDHMYYQAHDSVLYPSTTESRPPGAGERPPGATDRQYNMDHIASDQYSTGHYPTVNSQDDLGTRGQYRNDYSVDRKYMDSKYTDNSKYTDTKYNDSKYTDRRLGDQSDDKDSMTAPKRTTSSRDPSNIIHPVPVTAGPPSDCDSISFYNRSAPKHLQEEYYDNNIRVQEQRHLIPLKSVHSDRSKMFVPSIPSDRPSVFPAISVRDSDRHNMFQLSNPVRKQERKMKKMLQDLQKTDVTKASQLLEFYQFNIAVLEQQYERYRKDGCDITGQRLTAGDYDFQVQRVIQQVHQKISVSSYRQTDGHKPPGGTDVRKTRLLPKHAVKTLDTWFEENLSNPYPSRDQTLHLALDCGLSIEQVRKWFANKRNRSRSNKLYK